MSTPTGPHRLHVLRHATSSWTDGAFDDHDRPLAPRGRRAAKAMAERIGAIDAAPGPVLSSTARRAQETLDPLRPRLPDHSRMLIEPDLYSAPAVDLLARLRRVPEKTATVLVVGHNPGLEDLIRGLAGDGNPAVLQRVRVKYPTGALATIAFDGAWRSLGWGQGRLEAFVVPGDLA